MADCLKNFLGDSFDEFKLNVLTVVACSEYPI